MGRPADFVSAVTVVVHSEEAEVFAVTRFIQPAVGNSECPRFFTQATTLSFLPPIFLFLSQFLSHPLAELRAALTQASRLLCLAIVSASTARQ